MSNESKTPKAKKTQESNKLEVTVNLSIMSDIDDIYRIYKYIVLSNKNLTFEESNTFLRALKKMPDTTDNDMLTYGTSYLSQYIIIYRACSKVIQKHYAEQTTNASTIQESLKKLIEYAKNGTTEHTSKLSEEERTIVNALRKSNQYESITDQEMDLIESFRKVKSTQQLI